MGIILYGTVLVCTLFLRFNWIKSFFTARRYAYSAVLALVSVSPSVCYTRVLFRNGWNVVHFTARCFCISAVFAVARCLSVCLSVTLVYCIQTAEDIVKLLSRLGSFIILVFRSPASVPSSKGNPFSGAVKYKGWDFFCDFWRKSLSISERVRDVPMVFYGTKLYAFYRMMTFSVTLVDP